LSFIKAFDLLIELEGGYVDDPQDLGGETKFGISKRAYPDLDVKHLTIEDVKKIYYTDYWLKANCDKLPERLAIIHFIASVNVGIKRAIKILQKALNRQNLGVIEDGIFGKQTLSAVIGANLDLLLRDYTLILIDYYSQIARRKNLRKFLRGWVRRALRALDTALNHPS